MAILVSRNNVLGTAMTQARVAAAHLEDARSGGQRGSFPSESMSEALESLIQALAETAYVASGVGSVGANLRDLESDGVESACDSLAAKIRAALA